MITSMTIFFIQSFVSLQEQIQLKIQIRDAV